MYATRLCFFIFFSRFPAYPRLHPASQLALFASDLHRHCILERRYVESNVFQETVSRSTVPSLKKNCYLSKSTCACVCVCVYVCVKEREKRRNRDMYMIPNGQQGCAMSLSIIRTRNTRHSICVLCILTNIRYTIHMRMIRERKGNNAVNPNLSGFHIYI